jgi:hypothetical protein
MPDQGRAPLHPRPPPEPAPSLLRGRPCAGATAHRRCLPQATDLPEPVSSLGVGRGLSATTAVGEAAAAGDAGVRAGGCTEVAGRVATNVASGGCPWIFATPQSGPSGLARRRILGEAAGGTDVRPGCWRATERPVLGSRALRFSSPRASLAWCGGSRPRTARGWRACRASGFEVCAFFDETSGQVSLEEMSASDSRTLLGGKISYIDRAKQYAETDNAQ